MLTKINTFCQLCGKTIKRRSSLLQVKTFKEDEYIDVCPQHYSETGFWERIDDIKERLDGYVDRK
jgi:hypothetical protein